MKTHDQTVKTVVDWTFGWDSDLALWQQPGGAHTPQVASLRMVHPGPSAANRLLVAAHLRQKELVAALAILMNLRKMQVQDGSALHGCFRWYWEEKMPHDTNAAFFIGLPLIILWKCYSRQLSEDEKSVLTLIFEDLAIWFFNSIYERAVFYPNRYLGDLVCAWLLEEICGKEPERKRKICLLMEEAADYWKNNGWGWGEHLSDNYSAVCLDELSVLLLLGNSLPEGVRSNYGNLLADLLHLEDFFGKGPRVPAVRSYAFTDLPRQDGTMIPGRTHYRATIVPFPGEIDLESIKNRLMAGPMLAEFGWHEVVPPPGAEIGSLKIPCFNNQEAAAHIAPDFRVGCISAFPLMSGHEYPTCGLAWQTMPVAFWRSSGTWGFWQWETRENGRTRCQPADGFHFDDPVRALTQSVMPPIVPHTYALEKNGNVLMLRIIPAVPAAWETVTDRLRCVGDVGKIRSDPSAENWAQCILTYPERVFGILCLPLTFHAQQPKVRYDGIVMPERQQRECLPPTWRHQDQVHDWDLSYTGEALAGCRCVVTIWGFCPDGEVDSSPSLKVSNDGPPQPRAPEETAWDLQWDWPGANWRVRIDPREAKPLRLIE